MKEGRHFSSILQVISNRFSVIPLHDNNFLKSHTMFNMHLLLSIKKHLIFCSVLIFLFPLATAHGWVIISNLEKHTVILSDYLNDLNS